MTDTIKIITNQDTQATQSVEITPDPITPPTRTIPLEMYVQQLTTQLSNAQAQVDNIQSKLDALTAQNVDVSAVQAKLANKVATPIQKVIQ